MSAGAVMIGLAMLVLAVPFVASPLFQKKTGPQSPASRQASPAQAEGLQPEPVLLALRDLDFDYQIGKVSEEDYKTLRAQLVVEAARYLEAARKAKADELEEKIRRRKSQRGTPPERQEKANRSSEESAGASFCSKCGSKVRSTDVFCSLCGSRVQ